MAETRDLIVRSSNTAHTKSFIRIGDESPLSVSETGSSLQFLQNLSSSLCTFDTAGTTSAFRIRHDTVNGYLIFEGRSGSNGPYQLMRLNDDTNTVTFGGTVAFEDISFDQITGSHLYVGTSSQLLGTTSIVSGQYSTQLYTDPNGNLVFQNEGNSVIFQDTIISFTSSEYSGTASIWYDGTQMHIDGFKSGNSWKTQYKLTASYIANTAYPIYTTSINQQIQYYPYLSVFVNGDALIQSSSLRPDWDYQPNGSDSYSIKMRYTLPYSEQDSFYLTYMYNGGEY